MGRGELVVLAALFLVGTVLSINRAKCPKNELWLQCGTCEGHCYDRNPICTKECKPAGCYCPLGKGFVRFGYAGGCIPSSQCPNATDPEPPKCGKNEVHEECGCDKRCDQEEGVECPPVCIEGCYCKKGFVRGSKGKCVRKDQCALQK
ncbi:hypothetical protein QR680_006218 [Steinernema hermaphroditum]|uniref:TIL domain-containing protein n=1 Tax=Steinernema hermaphroditum TaxID=289476 RepID=A0AA39LWS2_9BILA|nr:hypothetical protein QR680_006218 [Steinernema hermaphroditum]